MLWAPVAEEGLKLQGLPGVERGHEELLLRHIGAALLEALRQRRAIHPYLEEEKPDLYSLLGPLPSVRFVQHHGNPAAFNESCH